jgi:hypothetical protein
MVSGEIGYFADPQIVLSHGASSPKNSGSVIDSVPSKFISQPLLEKMLMAKRKARCYYHTKKTILSLVHDFRESMKMIDFLRYHQYRFICLERGTKC